MSPENRGFVAVIERDDSKTLNVNQYLRAHGKGEIADQFVNSTAHPDMGAFVNRRLELLLQLVASDLCAFLFGTSWESVPVDWQGYR